MRVAHVTYSYKPIRGGADAYLADLYGVLKAAGHDQTVFQRQAGVTDPEVAQLPTPARLSPGRQFWYLSVVLLAYRRSLYKFDRVIVHYPNYALPLWGHPGLVGLSHGVTWDCAPNSRASRLKRSIARRAFHQCSRFVANDSFFLREVGLPAQPGQRGELAPGRWLIPNAVDLSRFSPDGGSGKEPVVLLPRNLYRNRGLHLGMEAFSQLPTRFSDYSLHIVGGDEDAGYRQELEALAAKLSLGNRVVFRGPTAHEVMPREYRRASLTLIPSLCGEGTSLSALESMACGTPVVATRVGGLPDLPCALAEPESGAL
ncbi:MAG TPA: glycosyltransferase family 4 protein, partial [Armatimonadota bacterium]